MRTRTFLLTGLVVILFSARTRCSDAIESTAEDTVNAFVASLQTGDFGAGLALCRSGLKAEKMDYVKMTQSMGAINPKLVL
ncbi:MAG: hypothetical protein LIP23_05060, partial [Planctomycetes bacterium]|nr:hypothetical protein [Planctomycetota bacterium]